MSDINEIGHGAYGEGVLDEPTTYRPEKGDPDPGLSSTYAAGTDPEELVNGGPRPEHGIMTTTGGNAGPNSFRPKARHGQGIAPTTTGDATTGSMDAPTDGATSDATSSAVD
ncbi:hypothetical protein GCM10010435_10140 [Winogradskya consettensis]|uniref:Uncharacterized protein n=1 Tax=Winogradskya consettensis TaxID=113560 RepID=A0A919T0N1_9ACTN|nr:hypothetical protein [Actinoplanes consettensis]GIM80811.1 hypothetical protein Aco04nite_72860 [Actinoplanes consettensis]